MLRKLIKLQRINNRNTKKCFDCFSMCMSITLKSVNIGV